MINAPRTRLNRLLLTAIGVMTLAILALVAAIIWKLFLEESPQEATPLGVDTPGQVRSLASGSASVRYILPKGCTDQITTGENSIQVRFSGASCAQRQIEAISGNVTLAAE